MPETLNIHEGDLVAFAEHGNGVLIKARGNVEISGILIRSEGTYR